MKRLFTSTLGLLIMSCSGSSGGNSVPDFKASAQADQPTYSQETMDTLSGSWQQAQDRLNQLSNYATYSNDFNFSIGLAFATASDTINSWNVVSQPQDTFYSPEQDKEEALMVYDDSLSDIDVKSAEDFTNFRFIVGLSISDGAFVIKDFADHGVKVQVSNQLAKRDIATLKQEIESFDPQGSAPNGVCILVGVLARELEKQGRSINHLRQLCNHYIIDHNTLVSEIER